jgi:DNA polymerase-3 subunit beta
LKLSCSRNELAGALQVVGRASSPRTAVPALGGILLEVGSGRASLAATDLEIGVEVELEAKVESEGTVVLPRLFADVVRTLSGDDVTIERREAEGDIELTAGASRIHLRTLAAEDFPRATKPEGDPVKIPAAPLAATIDRVARAASRDDARPILTGILVSAEEKRLTMVATDSYRLSVKHTELKAPLSQAIEANVPARTLREVSRLAPGVDADVEVWIEPNQAVFRVGGVLVSSRLIEGQFPNYRQLLPESFEHEVRLPRGELQEVAGRVSQLAQRNAPLRLAFSEGELTIAASTPEIGDASESMPANFQGEPLEIGFNPEFFKDGVDTVESDELVLKLISPLRPGLLEPVDSDDFSYLVMPIRLNV